MNGTQSFYKVSIPGDEKSFHPMKWSYQQELRATADTETESRVALLKISLVFDEPVRLRRT
jgi:hypothetical protein